MSAKVRQPRGDGNKTKNAKAAKAFAL